MKRRLFAMVLSLALILSLLPGQSFARETTIGETKDAILSLETGEPQLPVTDDMGDFDEDLTDGHEHFLTGEDEETVIFTTVLTAADLVSQYGKVTLKEGTYVLGEDLSTGNVGMLSIEGKVTLCLAGHDLDLGGNYIMFGGNGSTLQICDCAKEEKGQILTTSSTGAVLVNGNHTLELYGVSVKGTAYGINSQGGTVKIYDSTISVENMGEKNSAYAILVSGGSAVVENSVLTAQAGSAAFAVNSMNKNVLELKNSTLKGTAGSNAFGVLTTNGSVATMENCDLLGESTDVTGAAMGANSCGDLTAKNCRFTACGVGNNIFGIYSYGDVTASLTDCTITADSQNTGNATAMGANNGSGVMTLKNCTVLSKGAEGRFSFGAYSVGKIVIEDSSITSTGSGEDVYGLYNCGSAELAGDITLDGTVADIALGTDGAVNSPASQTVTLTAPLTGEDTFSVYTYAEPTASAPQMIVEGWDAFGTEVIPFYSVNTEYSVDEMNGALYLTSYHRHSLRENGEETFIFNTELTAADLVSQYGKVTLKEGTYVLGEDLSVGNVGILSIEGKVTLCLAGHDLDLGGNYIMFGGNGSTLQICDCAKEEKGQILTTSSTGAVLVNGNHTLELYGVSVKGTAYGINSQGGTVKIYDSTLSVENMGEKNSAYAILASGGSLVVENSLLTAQAASSAFPVNAMNKSVIELKDSTLQGKAGSNAFGLLTTNGSVVTMENCDLIGESTDAMGTAMGANSCGDLTAKDCRFTACGVGNNIFGIYSYGDVTASLTDCTITADSQNTGNATAMGANNGSGVMTLKNCTVLSKGAEGRFSFGAYSVGKIVIEDCAITSTGSGEDVYGLYNCGSAELAGEIVLDGTVADIALGTDGSVNAPVSQTVTLTAPLTGEDSFSVYTYAEPTASAPQLIVEGWKDYGTATIPFYSVNTEYSVDEMDGALYLTSYHRHSLRENSEETVIFSTVLTAADLVSQYGKVTLKEGTYVLGEDLSTGNVGMLSIEGKVTLCLAGHDLDLGGNYIMFGGNGSTLQICDCAKEEKGQILTTSSTGAVLVNGNHTVELYGVSVKGTSYGINSQGGTVKIYDSTLSVENMGEKNSAYAILASGGSLVVENSLLTAQAASSAFPVNAMNKSVIELKDSTLQGKAGSNAFGLLTTNGSVVTMENCDLLGESTDATGTAMGANSCGDLTAKNCRFTACGVGNNIFGIYSYGDVTASLTDCTITADSQNTGNATAMGANNGSGVMTLKNCTVLSKGAEGRFSFGAYSVGKIVIEDCSITSTGSGENVYGLYNCGSAELAGEIVLDGTVADIALGTDGSVNNPVSQTVTLIAPLTGEDTFSVYTYAEPTASAPQMIVEGWDAFGTETVPFYSAMDGFAVVEKENADGDKALYMVISDYEITVEDTVGGKLTVTEETALPGTEITVQAVAESGYLLQKLTAVCTNKAGEEIALPVDSRMEAGKPVYIFIMPEGNVTLKAIFEQKELKFRSISLSLESSIAMNFYIAESSLTDYTDVYILVEKERYDAVGNLLAERATSTLRECENIPVGGVDSRHYIYSNITSKEMSSKVYATIYAMVNGILIAGETREYSVVQYATNMIQRYQSVPLKTLLVDLLNYGTLAQQIFGYNNKAENYANASEIVQAAQIYATQTTPEILSYATNDKGNGKDLPASIPGLSLNLEDRVEINFYIKENVEGTMEDLQLVVTYEDRDGTLVREVISADRFTYDAQSKYYRVTFDSLNATDMRTVITACLEDGQGQVMSNIRTYSIESYAAAAMNNAAASDLMKELIVAMMKYGDATAAYFYGE